MKINSEIMRSIERFIEEDVGYGDITSRALFNDDIKAEARIITNEEGIAVGMNIIKTIFESRNCVTEIMVNEGEPIQKGTTIMEIKGSVNSILEIERVTLNILARMSGIATETRKLSEKAKTINKDIRIAATRKTVPGMRIFDKQAVELGGGDTHRLRLDDLILIKDNHLEIIQSIPKAVEIIGKKVSFTKKIEVEISRLEQIEEVIQSGADIVMLDNFSPKDAEKASEIIRNKKNKEQLIIEASGNISIENIEQYAKSGVDIISLGRITHSVKNIDMSLEIIKNYS